MSETKHWRGLDDPRFNELLKRALDQALCEFENGPVVAALCDAGVPFWFMLSLTRAMQLHRGIRFYLSSHDKFVVGYVERAPIAAAARKVLAEIGFKNFFDSGLGLNRLRDITARYSQPMIIAPDFLEPGPRFEVPEYILDRTNTDFLARKLPTAKEIPGRSA